MISRSTLVGALVVAELAIVGLAVRSVSGGNGSLMPGSGRLAAQPFAGRPFAGAGFASAPGRLDASFPTGPEPHVVIDTPDVAVVVEAAAEPVVRAAESLQTAGWVSGTARPLVASPLIDGVRIVAVAGGDLHAVLGRVTRIVRVAVPPGARVEIRSAGRIDASGLRTKLVAHSPDGSIHVRNHRGDLDVSSDSGRIELVDVQGSDIAANTHDGRLYLTRVGADRINGHTNDGRIYAVDLRVVDGALSTNSGRISASFIGVSDATVSASTLDGHVSVSGGESEDDGPHHGTLKLGSGHGRFEVTTDKGTVTISQGANV